MSAVKRGNEKEVRNEASLPPTDDASSRPGASRPDQREREHSAVYLPRLGNMFGVTDGLQLEVGTDKFRRCMDDYIRQRGQR